MAIVKGKLIIGAVVGAAAVVAFLLYGPGSGYSYHHPGVWHDCRMLQVDCPSHYAIWVPNGGSSPLYKQCACAAKLKVGGR